MSNSVTEIESCRLPEVSGTPLPAPLAFRVGVVGHRLNRLKSADMGRLANVLRLILQCVKCEVFEMKDREPTLFNDCPPELTAISPLAEGTDRLFAEQALELGYELCCVLPFAQAEFEKDFAERPGDPDAELRSLDRFRRLLARATTQFELDGNRSDDGIAYGQGGQVVLNQADLLVVVWDGERLGKRGGTEETFDEAQRRGVPVVWVDAHAPHGWQIVDVSKPLKPAECGNRCEPKGPADPADASLIRQIVRDALELPTPAPMKATDDHSQHAVPEPTGLRQILETFYQERQPFFTLAFFWRAFRDLVADSKIRPIVLLKSLKVEPFEKAVESEWPRADRSAIGQLVDRLRPYYAWPDKLAVIYSDRYRSAFILAFLLAASAVGMALFPVGMKWEHNGREVACMALELVAIVAILSLIQLGRWQKWHERWIDYRLVAELIRHLRLVSPLGGERPFPQVPAHLRSYGEPGTSWVAWYVRAIERSLGLPTTVVDRDHLQNSLAHLTELTQGQINFHRASVRRCHTIEKRLEKTEEILLKLTLASCALHLLPFVLPCRDFLGHWSPMLTVFCGFFPALGAALAGINNQAEFRRIKNRSAAMVALLTPMLERTTALQAQIEHAPSDSPKQFSIPVVALTRETAQLLIHEVLDWRVVFLDRPLQTPA